MVLIHVGELSIGTSPLNNDTDGDNITDGDGLTDSQETYTRTFTIDSRYTLSSDRTISLNARVSNSAVESVYVRFGLSGVSNTKVTLTLESPDGISEEIYNNTPSSGYLFNSTDITSMTSDYSGTWKLTVSLNSHSPSKMLEDFTLTFTMKTSPVNDDCDGDGLYDGEEATPGEDGYITDPNLADTDGDGLWDGYYTGNSAISPPPGEESYGTNPLNPDTDSDGVSDGDDLAKTSNTMMRITIKNIQIKNSPPDVNEAKVQVIIHVKSGPVNATYITTHIVIKDLTNGSGSKSLDITYFLDMSDIMGATHHFDVYLYRYLDQDSYLMNIEGPSTDYSYDWQTNANGGMEYINLNPNGDNASLLIHVEMDEQPRNDVFAFYTPDMAVNAKIGSEPLRYLGTSSYYVFILNTTKDSSDSTIQAGMNNTIIVPSSIFTNSYFYQHEILEGDGATNWPNLTFYGDNESSDSTTAHISGIITGNLTGDEVLELLTELSKNTTGIVTYNYSLEDPTQLNLPPDALKLVPFSGYVKKLDGKTVILKNARTSDIQEPPTISANGGYDTVNGLMDSIKQKLQGAVNLGISVGTAVWDKAVDLGTELAHIVCSAITAVAVKFTEFVVQLGKAIIDFGKKVIGAFEKAMAEVKAAVDKVVDVIGALLNSLVEMAKSMFNSMIESIRNAIHDWYIGIVDVVERIVNASSDEEAMQLGVELFRATFGSILPYAMALVIGIEAAIMIIQGLSGGLTTLILPLIAMVIITAFSSNAELPGNVNIDSDLTFEGLVNWVADNMEGGGSSDNSEEWNRALVSVVIGGFATLLALTGYTISWYNTKLDDMYNRRNTMVKEEMGEKASQAAILLGFLSMILSVSTVNDVLISEDARAELNLWSSVLAGMGIILSIVGMLLNPSALGAGGIILDFFALIMSGAGLALSGGL